MSIGTKVIQNALQQLKVHSVVSPANPESISLGADVLNSMIAEWQDLGIDMGVVPLLVPGGELSEPLGTRNGIESNLAVYLQPSFPGTQISQELRTRASKTLAQIKRTWRVTKIPKSRTRSTLPKGAGNKRYCDRFNNPIFFDAGDEIG
ncbi:MAG: hypothetical protein O7D95_06250 [Betaproteobacteria bacterium]|nr:hypothetical protein [Betaproteobacteria bacterium]